MPFQGLELLSPSLFFSKLGTCRHHLLMHELWKQISCCIAHYSIVRLIANRITLSKGVHLVLTVAIHKYMSVGFGTVEQCSLDPWIWTELKFFEHSCVFISSCSNIVNPLGQSWWPMLRGISLCRCMHQQRIITLLGNGKHRCPNQARISLHNCKFCFWQVVTVPHKFLHWDEHLYWNPTW